MKKQRVALFLIAMVMVVGASIGTALAYFTTYAMAKGGYPIHLEYETEIEEKISAMTKHVAITNDANGVPVYVRARAFAGSEFNLSFEGDGWSYGGDGYYYYSGILMAGETTSELLVKIDVPEDTEHVAGDTFNVVVVYESTPAMYDDEGKPYADWTREVITDKDEVEGVLKNEEQ